ncbi:hypothetical protein C8A01DRAFT_44493 [Parachaetomium inaequale]|uniref:N-acetyltransferase domain-containing protein n=1 Tax=Parachaetomium inaequale TaxID=2588326 RepID=A0AAN6PNP8_9PEZI|nr:hypothetical protein C8A01DRAFT_44493 [Parachaetomium inaequale]
MAQPMGLTAADAEFSEATPEQRQISWKLCGQSWAAPMSMDDYVEREQHMAEHELNRDGGCRYWVLYLKGYPRQVIASCETTRKPMLISDGNGRPARSGHGYAVTNVYTNPSYRRQGMAAFLLRRVQEQMDADSDCSVLFSDSGARYYDGLGWSAFASRSATLTVLPSSASPQQPTSQTRPLDHSNLPRLCALDELHLTEALNSIPPDRKTRVAFLPTHPSISWHLARAEFDAAKIFSSPPTTTPITIGAITATHTAWIYWSHDWRNRLLRVLRIVRASRDGGTADQRVGEFAALLGAAVAEARRWGLARVVVWNPAEEIKLGCKSVGNAQPEGVKVVFEDRVEGWIPSLRWNGGRGLEEVAWEQNNGYCWC